MARQRNDGRGRLGGRGKGTPNKVTTDLKTWVSTILDKGRATFEAYMKDLEPMEYIKVYTGLLNYVLPKQAPMTPEAIAEQEKKKLQELMATLPDEAISDLASKLTAIINKV